MANLDSLINTLTAFQKNNVYDAYSGYTPGAKLLSKIKQEEEAKQNEIQNQRAAEAAAEQTRQFNESLAEDKRAHNLNYAASMRSGGGSGGSLSEGEAKRLSTSALLNFGKSQYEKNKKSADAGLSTLASKHPLFYAINSMLYDDNIQNDTIEYGADQAAALSGVISSVTDNGRRVTPEDYIAYLEKSNNKAYLNQAAALRKILGLE